MAGSPSGRKRSFYFHSLKELLPEKTHGRQEEIGRDCPDAPMGPMGAYKKVKANMATLEKISPGPSLHRMSRFGQHGLNRLLLK